MDSLARCFLEKFPAFETALNDDEKLRWFDEFLKLAQWIMKQESSDAQLIDTLWRHVTADKTERYKMPLTETQKVAEIQSAYDSLKAAVATAKAQIATLNSQLAALQTQGTPITQDQISALQAVDALDTEVEADAAPAPAAAPATTPASS